ncbi:MAG: dihydrolipoyl dehydrogenase [Rhodanobacter thiooxydans]|uniref:dihydrolipoyl dehydrogenase n=1 Tax=Burkholderia sp. LMG 13014 TaxID=2709306 RepID=UPI0019648BA8|nr:dihydrolipoyl dehydrogenase [Burkholderia sp. LMG 13014]MCW0203735.1 dihydrolipoyl dehydrogenase [Rhodanobacter thiooxydans]
MQARKVDIAIIGAGTAGITAFHALKAAGKDVVLIDRGPLGTTCARVGCMPSKAALHAGMRWTTAKELPAGVTLSAQGPQALWRHTRQTRDALAGAAAERTRKAVGENLIMAEARFVAPGTLEVGDQRIEAKAFIVATGSHPVVPKSLDGAASHILTTDTLFEQKVLPQRLGILGLGAIGLELGLALSRLDVQVIGADQQDTIGGIQDPEVQDRALSRFGGEFPMWLGAPVEVTLAGDKVRMRTDKHEALVDRLLVVTGRQPNTEALNLQAAGILLDKAGRPNIDASTMQASDAPIFFAGDVQPDRPLMHEAADEGQMAAQAALTRLRGEQWQGAPRRVSISILFTDPDVCAVGMSYQAAMKKDAVVGIAEGSGNGRSKILGAQDNLLRIYVEPGTGLLLGASMLLTQGEHLAHLLAWAIQAKQTVNDLLTMPFYHPSIEEMLQSALKSASQQLNP